MLLVDLKKALQAKTPPAKVKRSTSLPFTYAILGENETRSPDGGFNDKPAGNWTAMKIFIEGDSDQGEVFLNFNSQLKKAEFSIKDPDYGDLVLAKLATVL